MSKSYMNIEKLCLESLHNGNEDVCNFIGEDKCRYVSDSYAVFVLPEKLYDLGKTFVRYPNNEKFIKRIYDLVGKYKKVSDLYQLYQSHNSVITRGYTASMYESYLTGDEVWIQDKYIVLFEPFLPEFFVYPKFAEVVNPVIVKSGNDFIGLIMPMHITEECRTKKDQPKLEVTNDQ